ncbi:MAG: hypothetical protein PHP42_03520 [Bacteroidota bacterium]|nr:hypothetical protein [Bacteroidota bacterium]
MIKKIYLHIFIGLAAVNAGCKLQNSTEVEQAISVSIIKFAQLEKDTINTDKIFVNGEKKPTDILTISIGATARYVSLASEDNIVAAITDETGSTVYGNAILHNDGITPDVSKNDSIASGTVTFTLPRTTVGKLLAHFATSQTDYPSNKIILPLEIIRKNATPIISNLVSPDTVTVGATPEFIFMSVAVSDSDGLDDLQKVQFNSFKPDGSPSSGNPFAMYDDGGANKLPGNDDKVAGDGVYSLTIQLPPTVTKGTYRFEFQAFDKSNAQSNTIIHQIVVR